MFNTKTKLAAFTLLFPFFSNSYAFTGNDLQPLCEKKSTSAICLFYIQGSIDGMILVNAGSKASGNSKNDLFCLPENASNAQLQDVAVKYMKENPEIRHEPASMIIYRSLRSNYPCKY